MPGGRGNPPRCTAECRYPARPARSDPCAGWRWPGTPPRSAGAEPGAVAVATDAGGAGIDHVADARYGQRSLGDVGGQHDLAPRARLEDFLLLDRRQARIQRQHLGELQIGLAQHLGGVANLAFAGQEHQHVAGRWPTLRSWAAISSSAARMPWSTVRSSSTRLPSSSISAASGRYQVSTGRYARTPRRWVHRRSARKSAPGRWSPR